MAPDGLSLLVETVQWDSWPGLERAPARSGQECSVEKAPRRRTLESAICLPGSPVWGILTEGTGRERLSPQQSTYFAGTDIVSPTE
jgi:hypothetical protein